jgi:hypothetical protein
MKHPILFAALIPLALAAAAVAQSRSDNASFELTPISPPVPALKYRLMMDPTLQHHGNAALCYMRAALLRSDQDGNLVEKASDAHNDTEFDKFAGQLNAGSPTVDLLLLAAQCDQCDWQSGLEERGFRASLPELNRLRELSNMLSVIASYQIKQDKIDDSLATLRILYEMGQKTATGPVVINGLIGVGMTKMADDRLIELMKRSDSPNLYWALASLPRPIHDLRSCVVRDRVGLFSSAPLTARAATHDLSPQEWKEMINQVAKLVVETKNPGITAQKHDFADDLKPGGAALAVLPAAQAHYAQTRKMSGDDVALLDSATVVANFYWDQYEQACEDCEKSLTLPVPQRLAKLAELQRELDQMKAEAPENPLLETVPNIERAAQTFARIDREVAALTAVEAIRSHAAAHDGKLPEHLEEITETPAPADPFTGQAFGYRMDNDSAVLSSTPPGGYTLEYTVRIRK